MDHNKLIKESENIFGRSLKAPSTEDLNLKEGLKRMIRRGDIKVTTPKGARNKQFTPTTKTGQRTLASTQRRYGDASTYLTPRTGEDVQIGQEEDQASLMPMAGLQRRATPGSSTERSYMPNPRFNPHGTNPGSTRPQKVGWKRGVKKPLAKSAEMQSDNQDPNLKEFKKFIPAIKRHGRKIAAGAAITAAGIGAGTALKPEPPKAPPGIEQANIDSASNTIDKFGQGMERFKKIAYNSEGDKRVARDIRRIHPDFKHPNPALNDHMKVEEGSGGEQSLHRQIAAAIKSGGSNPATNPLLRRLESRLKSKHKGADQRVKHKGMLVIPKEDREPKELKPRLQQRQIMRKARPVKTVGEKIPKVEEAVSKSGVQLKRVYKAGVSAGSGRFSPEKTHGEVQDQLDRIRNKGRKLALKDPEIDPKLKSKLRTPSQGVGDVATEKSLVKGITKGKAKKKARR